MNVTAEFCLRALFLYATLAVLYLGHQVLIPVALALTAYFILYPLVNLLTRLIRSRSIAATLVVSCLLAVTYLAGARLIKPAQTWLSRGPAIIANLESQVSQFRASFAKISKSAERIDELTEFGEDSREVVLEKVSVVEMLFSEGQAVLARTFVVILLLFLLLTFGKKAEKELMPYVSRGNLKNTTAVYERLSSSLSGYLSTIALINFGLAIALALAMFAVGLPNPLLWGAMGGVLNFIPFLGALTGTVVVAAVSLATFSDSLQILGAPLLYFCVTAAEGYLITPIVLGNKFSINPAIMLVWLLVWSFLWGITGALLAVPLYICIRIVMEGRKDFDESSADAEPTNTEPI